MTNDYDIITFDCYGTLIDWETGIARAFCTAARADGVELDAGRVLELYEHVEPAVEAAAYRPYREVLTDVATRCAGELGWPLDASRAGFLAESLPAWEPFPDTNPALERLKTAGYQLGILSNIDDALFDATRRHFAVDFDLVITAEQVRSYKPAHGHFVAARERIGDRSWLHAARSYFHDVVPARTLGIPIVWVNRKRHRPTGSELPDGEVDTLDGLVKWLGIGA